MIDLGTLSGSDDSDGSNAYGINDLGQVVGEADFNGANNGFIYDGSTMLDLNDLIAPIPGVVIGEALGINDSGQIVGEGFFNGSTHAYLLTPLTLLPEPTSLALLGAGSLLLLRRRRAA